MVNIAKMFNEDASDSCRSVAHYLSDEMVNLGAQVHATKEFQDRVIGKVAFEVGLYFAATAAISEIGLRTIAGTIASLYALIFVKGWDHPTTQLAMHLWQSDIDAVFSLANIARAMVQNLFVGWQIK